MKSLLFSTALLFHSFTSLNAQEVKQEWPKLSENGSLNTVGIRFTSQQPKWGVDSPPLFRREKAFTFTQPQIPLIGRFCTIAHPGGNGIDRDFTVFGLKKVEVKLGEASKVDQFFYNGLALNSYYGPVFSPSGQAVAFRQGLPPDDRRNGFAPALWNFKKEALENVPTVTKEEYQKKGKAAEGPTYFNPSLSWSPGGRYLTFLRGGDSVGGYFDGLGEPYSSNGYELFIFDTKNGGFPRQLQFNVGLSWSWTHHGTILFSRVTTQNALDLARRSARPSIYEVGVDGRNPKKVIDGGYFASESPSGEWIAYIDWPGRLIDQSTPPLKDNSKDEGDVKKGIYLFHRPTGKRIFVSETPQINESIMMQWGPDSQNLYLMTPEVSNKQLYAGVYNINLPKSPLIKPDMRRLCRIKVDKPLRGNNMSNAGWFEFRGTSYDGRLLYANTTEIWEDGPKEFFNTRNSMWVIETSTGKVQPIGHLLDIAFENPGWDWHDDSGLSPAYLAVQKIEDNL